MSLHGKIADYGCNIGGIVRPTFNSQIPHCLTSHDATTKLVTESTFLIGMLSLVEKPKDHSSQRSDNLLR